MDLGGILRLEVGEKQNSTHYWSHSSGWWWRVLDVGAAPPQSWEKAKGAKYLQSIHRYVRLSSNTFRRPHTPTTSTHWTPLGVRGEVAKGALLSPLTLLFPRAFGRGARVWEAAQSLQHFYKSLHLSSSPTLAESGLSLFTWAPGALVRQYTPTTTLLGL